MCRHFVMERNSPDTRTNVRLEPNPIHEQPMSHPNDAFNELETADYSRVRNAALIGAGIAGLVTAKTLLAQGIACTLFERSACVGGVWADGYLNFGVQLQKELFEFPDWPLKEDTPQFTPGPIFKQYLDDYADHFAVRPHIRFNTSVDQVEPIGEQAFPRWRVKFREASEDGSECGSEDFDLVVVCTGLYSNIPHLPKLPAREDYQGKVHHVSEIKSPAMLEGKRVGILGFGKSATDIAIEAAEHASETHLVARQLHWPIPRKLAGVLPFKWGVLSRLSSALYPLYKTPSRVERALHMFGKPLVWSYWRLVETLLRFQFRLGSRFGTRVSLVPAEPMEIDTFGEASMVLQPDLFRLVRQGRISLHQGEVISYTPTGIKLACGAEINVDVVVAATGWRCDHSFLSASLRSKLAIADDGLYLYRQMLHPEVPGLVFIGYSSTVTNILTYSLQARWLGELLAGKHQLPSNRAMADEIEALKSWKRSWMPPSTARGARLIAHMQHYHDELLRDFGANPRRKRGFLAVLKEVISPYQPSDYRAIAAGDWEKQEGRYDRCA